MTNIVPADVSGTLSDRFVTVRRDELPDEFWAQPLDALEHWKSVYHEKVREIDSGLAATHNDWSVRVEIGQENSMSVADAGVFQQEEWVEFRGMAARIGQPKPRALSLAWVCRDCGLSTRTGPDTKPQKCSSCSKRRFDLDKRASVFVDSQQVVLAERFEEIDGSRPPRLLNCRMDGTLIQQLNPGERCVAAGVMKLVHAKAGYDYELWVNNMIPYRAVNRQPPVLEGDAMARLVESYAPQIYGYNTIKESILLLLAGGPTEPEGRASINMLLVGGPGVAKSTLLKEAARVAPLGRYTSGRGATAAGLTAGVAKDRDGVMYLEAGVTVLTDGGVVCIDEFDKMQKSDRDALHEVMEQQSASITKIGMTVTLNARVSILAAANPKKGSWDDDATPAENINLPDTLLTRFDLIYNIRDEADADEDRAIARHILRREKTDALPPEAITAYLESVRPLEPVLSDEAADTLEQYYTRTRMNHGEIIITARQLEAARRLAGARAKIYRRKEITARDAERAIHLVEHMIRRTMTDPATGQSRRRSARVDEATTAIEGNFTAADVAKAARASFPDIKRAPERLGQRGGTTEGQPGAAPVPRRPGRSNNRSPSIISHAVTVNPVTARRRVVMAIKFAKTCGHRMV